MDFQLKCEDGINHHLNKMAENTLWNQVQKLPIDAMRQVQSLYGTHFPIEVRHFFSSWLEQQPWSSVVEENPEHEEIALKLTSELINLIEEKAQEWNSGDMFLTKLKLQQTAQTFRDMYSANPMNLIRVLNNCLATEQKLVDHFITNVCTDDRVSAQATAHKHITEQFIILQTLTQECEEMLRGMLHEQESFILLHQEYTKINAQLASLQSQPNGQTRHQNEQRLQHEKLETESKLRRMAQSLLNQRQKLAKRHKSIFEQLSCLQTVILDEQLISWKRQQQLAGNGAPFEGSLETLQLWCESLAELTWTNRQQIKKVEMQRAQLPIDIPREEQDLLPYLTQTITGILSNLVTSTFIIEKQPPQVLKKDAKFTATVRLLVGGRLNVHMNPPTVKATIISEDQARAILKNEKNAKNESSGDIVNSQGQMEYNQANGQLAIMFRNMQLKRIRRAEKKGNETVTEEKFCILFQSQFTVGGGELVFQVWTLSLPVVVTVHGNQECNALATILWDNAFAESGRVPFHVPEKVPWNQLVQALNTKFAAACGKGLSHENVSYLMSKIFGHCEDITGSAVVSWSQFNREPLQSRNFTFWEWFYAIMKLTKDWLQGPWKENYIVGFIGKQRAQDWLMKCPNGTFLLRFSDSELGGITIAWVADDPNKPGERQVWNLAPFTEKDFKIRSVGDRIKDLEHLTYLYPNIQKKDAFGKFWSQDQEDSNLLTPTGYVRADLATTLPGLKTGIMMKASLMDDPRSPQPFQPQSPANSDITQRSVHMSSHSPNMAAVGHTESLAMETGDDPFQSFMTDYNPSDIESININELLGNH